jgi:hypothetical protein
VTAIPDQAVEAARYGLKWEADRQGLNLFSYDVERMARNALHHALKSGHVVTHADMDERLAKERRNADVQLRRACAAEVNADRQLSRLERALAAWPDREAAELLAKKCGVLLLLAEPND